MAENAEGVEQLPEGVTVEDISSLPLVTKLLRDMKAVNIMGIADGFSRFQPYNEVFPNITKNYLGKIRDFEVKEDDIWVCAFPKSGTTWAQEMVWCIKNNVDLERARLKLINERVPYFEVTAILPSMPIPNSFERVTQLCSPRIIKSHLTYDMLPAQCKEKKVKIIHLLRNPRDACVSFYHHYKIMFAYAGTFDDFAELFLNDVLGMYSPCIHHVLSYWNQRHLPNILMLTFEEMKRDLAAVIRKVAQHLDVTLQYEQIKMLEEHLSFGSMQKNTAVNYGGFIEISRKRYKDELNVDIDGKKFIRKGNVGSWKEHFNNDLLVRFKEWENRGLKDSDLQFVFE